MANKKIRVIGKLPKNKNIFVTGGAITDLVGNGGTNWNASFGNGFDMSQIKGNEIYNIPIDKAQSSGSPVLTQGINGPQQNQGGNGFMNFVNNTQNNMDPIKKMSNTAINTANNIMDTISRGKSQAGATTADIQQQRENMAESGKRVQALRLNTSRGLNDNPNINNGDNLPDFLGFGLGMIGKGIRDKRNRERLPLAQRIGLVTRSAYGGPKNFSAGGAIGGASNIVNGVSMLTENMVNQMQTTEDAQAIKEGILGSQFGIQEGGDSFDLLAEDINSYSDLNHLTKKDLRDRTVLEDIGNVLQATSEGAQYGFKAGNGFSAYGGKIERPYKSNKYLAGGIIGAIVGGAAGLGTSLAGVIQGNKNAKNEAEKLNKDIDYTNAFNNRMINMRMENIMQNRLDNQLASYSAFGGPKFGFSDFDNGITYVNNGGTHEENIHGGVFMGTDEQGVPNLLEEGEVLYDNYVFSNRLMPGKSFKKQYKIKGKKSTFADAAKQISEEFEERPNDPISELTHNVLMHELMGEHENVRKKMADRYSKSENKFGDGGELFTELWNKYSSGEISKEEYRKQLEKIPEKDRIYLSNNKKQERTYLPYLWKTDNNKNGRQYESTKDNEERRASILANNPDILKRVKRVADRYNISPKAMVLAMAREGFVDRIGKDKAFLKDILSEKPKDSISGAMNFGLHFGNKEYKNGEIKTINPIEVLPEDPEILKNHRKGIEGAAFRNLDDSFEMLAAKIKSIQDSLKQSYSGLSDEDLYYLTRAFYNRGPGNAADDYENNNWNVNETYNDYGAYDRLQYPETSEPSSEEDLLRLIEEVHRENENKKQRTSNTTQTTIQKDSKDLFEILDNIPTFTTEYPYNNGVFIGRSPQEQMEGYRPVIRHNFWTTPPLNIPIDVYRQKVEETFPGNKAPYKQEEITESNGNETENQSEKTTARRESVSSILPMDQLIPKIDVKDEKLKLKYRTPAKSKKDLSWVKKLTDISPDIFAGISDLISRNPDYAKAIDKAASKTIPNIGFNPIGNYVPIKIFDRNYPANMLLAKNAATRRALGNNAAAILAADYNTGLELGDLYRKADEANMQNLLQAENFNRGTNMFNSEGELKAAASNQNAALHNKSLGIQAAAHAAAMRDKAYQTREAIKSQNYNNLKQNILNKEREDKDKAMLAMLGKQYFRDDTFYNDYLSMLGIKTEKNKNKKSAS